MKRSKKKLEIMKANKLDKLPVELRRVEYFARLRGKHAKGYMKYIARKGAIATNARRRTLKMEACG